MLNDGRELRFNDARKFGRWYLFKNAEMKLKTLGREPLEREFTEAFLAKGLTRRRRQLKPLLLDQSFVAGLGNIYVDEALFEAKLHPERISDTLRRSDARALHKAIVKVLTLGIKNLGTSLGTADTNFYSIGKRRGQNQDSLRVFRRTGEACPRCGSSIQRIIVAQRSSHVCLKCQKQR